MLEKLLHQTDSNLEIFDRECREPSNRPFGVMTGERLVEFGVGVTGKAQLSFAALQ
jgi:hypothetical protein